jgi:hypothetical protein
MRAVGDVLERLAVVDAERLELIATLRTLGFRSRGFVGEYGELIACALYPGSRLASPSQAGYDLVVEGLGLVQVKTLRSTPANHRTSMGIMRDPYDMLFALRLDVAFKPVSAWEIPRAAVEAVYPHGTRTSLTQRLVADATVREIEPDRLRAAALAVASGEVGDRASPRVDHD